MDIYTVDKFLEKVIGQTTSNSTSAAYFVSDFKIQFDATTNFTYPIKNQTYSIIEFDPDNDFVQIEEKNG